uniref:V2 n=2 Tax=Capulavirus medicagonis TaxID=1306546 RepID=A0A1X9QM34_9GEMI|nr:V2 [Alfalfa leaf curl virus]AVH79893.1 V2 [Alfalfa leaf curl virus]
MGHVIGKRVYGILCCLDFLVAKYRFNFFIYHFILDKWKVVYTCSRNCPRHTGNYRAFVRISSLGSRFGRPQN